VTTLGERSPGDPVQLEVDVVAKYVERLVAPFLDRAGAPMRAGAHEASVDGRVRQ
jgi:riboflavin synthase